MQNINSLPLEEMYEKFKGGIIDLVHAMYSEHANDEGSPEPIVFIGIRTNRMRKLLKELPPEVILMLKGQMADEDPDLEVPDDKINVVGLPMGPFFQGTGIDMLDMMGKQLASKAASKFIDMLNQDSMNNVMFSAFVSEAYVHIHHMTEEQKKKLALGQDPGIDDIRPSQMPDAQESVMVALETRTFSELVTMPIKTIGTLKEIGEPVEMGRTTDPGKGIMSGLVHRSDAPRMN